MSISWLAAPSVARPRAPRPWMIEVDRRKRPSQPLAFLPDRPVNRRHRQRRQPIEYAEPRCDHVIEEPVTRAVEAVDHAVIVARGGESPASFVSLRRRPWPAEDQAATACASRRIEMILGHRPIFAGSPPGAQPLQACRCRLPGRHHFGRDPGIVGLPNLLRPHRKKRRRRRRASAGRANGSARPKAGVRFAWGDLRVLPQSWHCLLMRATRGGPRRRRSGRLCG